MNNLVRTFQIIQQVLPLNANILQVNIYQKSNITNIVIEYDI